MQENFIKSTFIKSTWVKQLLKQLGQIPLFLLSLLFVAVAMLIGVITITFSSLFLLVLCFKSTQANKAQEHCGHTLEAEYHIVE